MKTQTIVGSMRGGGDGSVSVHWFSSKELAEWDQDHLDEGWGETCTTTVTVAGEDAQFTEPKDIDNPTSYLVQILMGNAGTRHERHKSDQLRAYLGQFFPNGVPTVAVQPCAMPGYAVLVSRSGHVTEYATYRMWSGSSPEQLAKLQEEINVGLGDARRTLAANPVHQDSEDHRWYFWDETWAHRFGPYNDQHTAEECLTKYLAELTKVGTCQR